MSIIIDTIQAHLPPKRKATPSGWVSFNAVCCHHNGTSADTRGRGGIHMTAGESVSYHCFNCGFKASWQIGRKLTPKFKKLLQWFGVSDDLITKCTFEALRTYEDAGYSPIHTLSITMFDKAMPRGAKPITTWINEGPPDDLMPVLEYMASRSLYLEDYEFWWSDEDGITDRLLIPFYYDGRIVGYTGRKIRKGKPKYLSEQQPGYVFNLDAQTHDRQWVFVFEGPIDAISIDATALMGAEIAPAQAILISRLQKQPVLVPDRDESSKKLVEQAMSYGWHVSFPDWSPDIKDANEAVQKYGRLYVLYSIIKGIQTTNLKIQLAMKHWFKEIQNDDDNS